MRIYHWWELPQVQFLSQQNNCQDKHVFLTTNMCLLQQNTSSVMTKTYFPQQNILVATKHILCHDKNILSATKYPCCNKVNTCLSWEKFCHEKHTFVTAEDVSSRQTRICHEKSKLVEIKLLSRQNYVCPDKYLSQQNFWCDQNVSIAPSIFLSRQKTCFVTTPVNT